MFSKLFGKKPAPEPVIEEEIGNTSIFSTDLLSKKVSRHAVLKAATERTFQKGAPVPIAAEGVAMDGISGGASMSMLRTDISDSQLLWYGSQGFIGYQSCAMIAQHWLVDKACTMPARDAVRTGYEIGADDGEELDPKVISFIKEKDKEMRLDYNLEQFSRFNRIFGIRIALFKVESDDLDYYEKPFNPDGVKEGSYKGISQIDPYWITPELSQYETSDPSAINFYEPEFWRVSGKRYHRSHLIVVRLNEVPDILKPTYLFGGVSIPQKIYERVYGAERTANEAPMLAMTKRLNTLKIDTSQGITDSDALKSKIENWVQFKDNYGVKLLGENEEAAQFDTSLADLDAVIMTQYQIVAAASNVPATKLLGTQPKGFNSSGDYEESAYHEELESIQTHELQPLIDRHHLLLMKSEVQPKFGKEFNIVTVWNKLDTPTAKEQAEINKLNADTDAVLSQAGALDGQDIRARLIATDNSGYNGLSAAAPEPEHENEIDNPEDDTANA